MTKSKEPVLSIDDKEYSMDDLEIASRVIRMTDGEREHLFSRNTALMEYVDGLRREDLKKTVGEIYTTTGGLGTYDWSMGDLTDDEIDRIIRYTKNYRALTDMSESEIASIGSHAGKICIVHWITEEYGDYVPGDH